MKAKDINELLTNLAIATSNMEEELEENGGEFTESIELQEEQICDLQDLLTGEGLDTLGRWLKSRQDEAKSLKAEKDYLTRRIKANSSSTDYILDLIGRILRATGQTKVKSTCGYAFTPAISETTAVNKEALNAKWLDVATKALKDAGVPDYIRPSLSAAVSLVPEGEELPDIFEVTRRETCRFTKPRAAKE